MLHNFLVINIGMCTLAQIKNQFIMKKILLLAAIVLGSQAFAQSAPLNGVEFVEVKQNVKDFTITDDEQAYTLHRALLKECDSYTVIDNDILGSDAIHGVFFYFKDEKVLYILCRGGVVKGSLIQK
jgi:hypothetical protein